MLVRELMSTDVVTCHEEATLREAVGKLCEHGVGSVIVLDDDGHPVGMVTETDALQAGYDTDRPFSEIRVGDLSHRAVVTVAPEKTVQHVARKMSEEGVKKVPVMDHLELLGIVTLTDIVWKLPELRSEAADLASPPREW